MANDLGWIKLYRKIQDNPSYFSEPFCRNMAWIDMLLLANRKEGFYYLRGIKVVVNRGQIGVTVEKMGERWKWSRGKVLRQLKQWEIEGQIVQQKNNVTTLISILNYDEHQRVGTANDTAEKPNSSTANDTADGLQTDINKNILTLFLEDNTLNYNVLLDYHKSSLIEILIDVFKKEKAETLEEALLQIAYLIATVKKISKHDAVNDKLKSDEILISFDKIASYLINTDNKFFFKLNLMGISKPQNFQGIFEAMKDLMPTVKSEKLEEKRISQEEYFNN